MNNCNTWLQVNPQLSSLIARLSLALLVTPLATSVMAQTNLPIAQRWLDAASAVPEFQVPKSKTIWERQRRKVRAQLWELLGNLPPRPKRVAVETLSRKDHGDYVVEKFQFDNGAGATVLGYLLLFILSQP